MIADILKEEITSVFNAKIQEPYAAKSNWISGLAWGVRHMVLKRVAPELSTPISIASIKRMERGKEIERYFLNSILPASHKISVVSTGRPVEYKKFEISGKMDAELDIENYKSIPAELKSYAYFSRYSSANDLLSGSVFDQNAYFQLTFYLLCAGKSSGVFLIVDPASYDFKTLDLELNYSHAEPILKKCETVNALVRQYQGRAFPPEDVEDLPECDDCSEYCQFTALCGRSQVVSDLADLDLGRVDELAARRLELATAAKEYDEVNDELKRLVAGHPSVITPRHMITGGEGSTTVYNVPADIRGQYAEKRTYWRIKKVIEL